MAELPQQRPGDVRGNLGLAGVAGLVPGTDQAAERPLGLDRPDGLRIALGGVLIVPDQVGQANLIPGDALPVVVEVVNVPVGDDDAGEGGQDPEVPERFQGAPGPGRTSCTAP